MYLEEFDTCKTKVLKYIMYKKRSENEVRTRFQNEIDESMLEDIIEYLKEAGYINDNEYIRKTINNFQVLKNLSITELKYKLLAKGLKSSLIEDYFYENKDELNEYEVNSAMNLILKKQKDMEDTEIRTFLMKKGYKKDNIDIAFDEIKDN